MDYGAEQRFRTGALSTTFKCDLRCVMCPLHGEEARKRRIHPTLAEAMVKRFLNELPGPQRVTFTGGEPLIDPNIFEYIEYATERGHRVSLLTNGQHLSPQTIDRLLDMGVEGFHISVDSIDHERFAAIRIHGNLQVILDAIDYLHTKRAAYPRLHVVVNVVLFEGESFEQKSSEYAAFWAGKADRIHFMVEHHMGSNQASTFFEPVERVPCDLFVRLSPNGKMTPCCSVVSSRGNDPVEWLPAIHETTPQEAFDGFVDMYRDPESPLRQVCKSCTQWKRFARDENGNTPYRATLHYDRRSGSYSLAPPRRRRKPSLLGALRAKHA
jgi:organic radical activating enzyme